jgi:outer membrane receptor protein involved in Fe transport
LWALVTPAIAQRETFRILPGPLKSVLDSYARQTHRQVIYRIDEIRSVRSPGVQGQVSADAALKALLTGTGFSVKADSSGALAIVGADRGASLQRKSRGPFIQQVSLSVERPAEMSDIVVTGTRISNAAFAAPTPITQVDEQQLTVRPQLAESLRELPTLRNSTGPQTHFGDIRSIGRAQMNLRNLGPQRTLVLLNGQRFVTSLDNGAPDVALFPSSLIERVDIVTGGASAAYGSDAVAGVVNFIMNRDFNGLKAGISGGISSRGDNRNWSGNIAYGSSWGADDRGRVVLSYETSHRDGMLAFDRKWARKGVGLVTYPDQLPRIVRLANVRRSDMSEFGVVASGPLRGTSFTADGRQRPFEYGTGVTSTNMIGGEGPYSGIGNLSNGVPVTSHIAYAQISYELFPEWTVSLDGNFGRTVVTPNGGINYLNGSRSPTITRDNAFLDQDILARMVESGVEQFQVNKQYDFGDIEYYVRTTLKRGTLNLQGRIGPFKAEGYVTYGRNSVHNELRNMLNVVHLYRAVDAATNPANGKIVCRSTLTDPTNGCVPYNVMARAGFNSPASLNYIKGNLIFDQITDQLAAGINFSGKILDLPAGPVSVAFGGEFRDESYRMIGDDLSQRANPVTGAIGWWRAGSAPNVYGSNSSKGVFAELAVPVLKDHGFFKGLDVNVAVRATDYRFSGSVATWKLGANWEVIDGLRFRVTRSRDIREPTLGQLYAAGGGNGFTLIDRVRGDTVPTSGIQRFTAGNLSLLPEVANSLSYGVVLSPRFAPGLTISVDHYDINIRKAIASLEPQAAINECAAGTAIACSSLLRDANGKLVAIYDTFYNLAVRRVSGVDLEGRYTFALSNSAGKFIIRALANYQSKDISALPGSVPVNRAGETGISALPAEYQLKWRGSGSLTYVTRRWSASLIGRYSGRGVRNVLWKEGVDIDDNSVPDAVYLDFQYLHFLKIGRTDCEINFTINNLLDKSPPLVGSDAADTVGFGTNSEYDLTGAAFRIGMKVRI